MKKNRFYEAPEALQGLGLTQQQLHQVQRYFALRVHHSRNQRYTILGALLVLLSSLATKSLLDDGTTTPSSFETFAGLVTRWAPVVVVVLSGIAIGMQKAIVYQLRKRLPELGMSQRAADTVNAFGDMMARHAFFHNKVTKD